jgi:hypothetical protein
MASSRPPKEVAETIPAGHGSDRSRETNWSEPGRRGIRVGLGLAGGTATTVGAYLLWRQFQPGGRDLWWIVAVALLLAVGITMLATALSGIFRSLRGSSGLTFLATVATLVGTILAMLAVFPPDKTNLSGCPKPDGRPVQIAHMAISGGVHATQYTHSDVSYALSGTDQFYLSASGSSRGPLPAGMRLYLLGTADKDSRDSFGNAGTGRFLPQQALEQGCWKLKTRKIAYPGACGLLFRYYVTLAPDSRVADFEHSKEVHDRDPALPNDGLTPDEIEQRKIELLSFFEIPTHGRCAETSSLKMDSEG